MSTPGDTSPGVLGERVLNIAREAIFGSEAQIVAVTRTHRGQGTNVRVRPCAAILATEGGGDSTDAARDRRKALVCERIASEVERRMPLAGCTVRHNGLDGDSDVDVRVPGRRTAWSRARQLARADPRARALCWTSALLVVVAASIIAIAGGYTRV